MTELDRSDLLTWEGARYRPILFARANCPGCSRLRDLVAACGWPAIVLDIEADDRALRLLLSLAGCAWVPTVVFRHEIAIGCDVSRVEEMLRTPYEPLDDYADAEEFDRAYGADAPEEESEAGVTEPAAAALVAVEVQAR